MNRKDCGEGHASTEKPRLFDSSIVGTAQQAVDFITNILESSTEYSVIAKDLVGKIAKDPKDLPAAPPITPRPLIPTNP